MKISYCAHAKIPSKEANSIHVMKMCNALSKNRASVSLVVPETIKRVGNPYSYYGVNNSFEIVYKKWPHIKTGVLFYSIKVLFHFLKDRNQCIYGRDITSCFLSCLFGFKTIWESHTPIENIGKPYELLFRLMLKSTSLIKIVVITSSLKQYYMEKYGISTNRIIVIPDASDEIDTLKISPKVLDNKGRNFAIGYIGQLYPGKGMEIISKLVPLCKNVMFHIVGGNDKDILFWKEELRKEDNICFHGFVKPVDIPSYGLAMDALIAPYLNKVQGADSSLAKNDLSQWMSPLKLFEYMSYKKPIIASNLLVLHDILHSGNSLLCDPNNIDEWCNAINSLIDSKELQCRLSNCAYSEFIEKYTWSQRARKIIELFEE